MKLYFKLVTFHIFLVFNKFGGKDNFKKLSRINCDNEVVSMRACKQCKRIFTTKNCPVCKIEGTRSFQGIIVVFDPESQIAKKMEITAPGKYAVKV